MKNQEIKELSIKKLKLWSENPRDPLLSRTSDLDIICDAITTKENKWELQKLMNSMGEYYDYSELPTVVFVKGEYVVYDGNRRVAILKYLIDENKYNAKGVNLKHRKKEDFKLVKKIPCNICSIEVALDNVERKHINNGTWNELERDYFKNIHRGEKKTLFVQFEEATGLVSKYPKLNQRFVKEEVFRKSNLDELGFGIDENNKIISTYDRETTKEIFGAIIDAVESKQISTRNNRGKLLDVITSQNSNLVNKISPYDASKENTLLEDIFNVVSKTALTDNEIVGDDVLDVKKNKTRVTKQEDVIFGRKLILREGKVNDLYRSIDKIYSTNKNNSEVLPIIAMSLRLILEVGARVYYDESAPEENKKDQLLKGFLDKAKKDMKIDSTDKNYLALTSEWLDTKINLEAILAKYAHGSISYEKGTILKHSKIVGEIIEFYFKK